MNTLTVEIINITDEWKQILSSLQNGIINESGKSMNSKDTQITGHLILIRERDNFITFS